MSFFEDNLENEKACMGWGCLKGILKDTNKLSHAR